MGFFDRPDKAIADLHQKAEDLATQAKHAKDPKRADHLRSEATRLTRKAAFVRGNRED